MTTVKVDLAMLLGMAQRYEECAEAVAELNTTKVTENLEQALPDTDTGRFAASVGGRLDAAFDATGNRIGGMARACRSAANNYERTDEAFTDKLAEKGVL